ncbi:La-related protein 6 [Hordeum vulgare]|nr:La-related protein 6 [Hordeum vulgare]
MASLAYAGEVGAVHADPSIPEEHLVVEVGEDVDYVTMSKTSSLRTHVFMYLRRAGYDIKLVNIDGFTRAMSQVKWSTGNAFGSTTVNLPKGIAADSPPRGHGFAILVCHRAPFIISEGLTNS